MFGSFSPYPFISTDASFHRNHPLTYFLVWVDTSIYIHKLPQHTPYNVTRPSTFRHCCHVQAASGIPTSSGYHHNITNTKRACKVSYINRFIIPGIRSPANPSSRPGFSASQREELPRSIAVPVPRAASRRLSRAGRWRVSSCGYCARYEIWSRCYVPGILNTYLLLKKE